jgi:hypothetical protein
MNSTTRERNRTDKISNKYVDVVMGASLNASDNIPISTISLHANYWEVNWVRLGGGRRRCGLWIWPVLDGIRIVLLDWIKSEPVFENVPVRHKS